MIVMSFYFILLLILIFIWAKYFVLQYLTDAATTLFVMNHKINRDKGTRLALSKIWSQLLQSLILKFFTYPENFLFYSTYQDLIS